MTLSIKQIGEEFSKGNFSAVYPYFSESIQWNIIGNDTLKGKENVIAFCDKMIQETASSVMQNTTVLEMTDSIAVEGVCTYESPEGLPGEVRYADFYQFKDGKVETINSYCLETKKV